MNTSINKYLHAVSKLIGLLGLIAFMGCIPGDTNSTPKGAKPPEATTSGELYQVHKQKLPTVAKVQGSLYVDESSTIAARVAGRVLEVNCDLGDIVEQDQLLIRIDALEYQLRVSQMEAQLAQARAAIGLEPGKPVSTLNPMNSPPVRETQAVLEEAQKQVKRLAELFKQGAIVATELEAAQSLERVSEARFNSALNSVREKIANVDVQSAQLDLAKQNLEETRVTSPFKATVQRRLVASGTYVQTGQPLVELVRTDVLRFRAAVPERYAQLLATGQLVRLNLASGQREAKVSRISPALDQATRSLTFEALVDNTDQSLRGGLFASAEVVVDDNSEAIAVPASAVLRFAGTDKAWLVADGKVKEAVVQIGRQVGDQIEILEGLEVGDQILLEARTGKAGKYADTDSSQTELANRPAEEATAVAAQSGNSK
jgi:membrane fusion protein, multidrug efflux system